ncbi:hypothetical protein [Nocardia nepalensis]|uniref:hypothetical protein n=1 Tax=Nocardia nepalensis TaxID=3375448 RepID=UPI003B67404C
MVHSDSQTVCDHFHQPFFCTPLPFRISALAVIVWVVLAILGLGAGNGGGGKPGIAIR